MNRLWSARVRLFAFATLLLLALTVPFYSFAASSNVVVKPSAMNGWYFWNDAADTFAGSPGAMVVGPAGQPLGAGSARLGPLTTASGATGQSMLATDSYAGVNLADLSSIDYWSYQSGPVQAPAIQFDVQYRLTDVAYGGRLVYEPYQNGAVTVGSGWQHWTGLLSGKWWATKTNSAGTGGTQVVPLPSGNCGISTPCTWTQILDAFPSARIAGRFAVKAGSNWSGFDGNADAVRVVVGGGSPSDNTYDFEPETQCSNDCYVNSATGNDAFGGDTPSSAKKTIQAAVNQVAANGTVHVASGTYSEAVTINKDNLTIEGAGMGLTNLQSPSVCTVGAGPTGIALTGDRTNITIKDLSISGYRFGMTTGNIGNTVSNITVKNINSSSNCAHGIWFQAGTTTNVMFDTVTASNNGLAGSAGRGLWLINGSKIDVTVKDGTFSNNNLVGIDFSDGNATGTTITGNVVVGNGDSGIALLGAMGPGANLVDGNTVTNNGRFGIEIKGPGGNGNASGPGSVVVSNNDVSRNVAATDARDYAGILVIQRLSGNAGVDAQLPAGQPTGVVITGNTVSGYQRKPVGSTGDGFGIVVEGTNQTVDHNIVSGNDVGIQAQAGNPSINAQSTAYFDRGNAASFSGTINRNSISGNGTGFRAVGLSSSADATCNWWGDGSGPGPVGSGSGDTVSANASFAPWLISSDLDGTCIGGTANGNKQVVLATLQSLLPTGDKKADDRIQKAIERLQKSLTISWWTGSMTLDPKEGKHVFDEEKHVVDELSKKELDGNPVAQSLIQTIVSVDRSLAQYAIDNAVNPKPADLAKANDEMAKGDADAANGKPQNAIEHYKNAWDKITK